MSPRRTARRTDRRAAPAGAPALATTLTAGALIMAAAALAFIGSAGAQQPISVAVPPTPPEPPPLQTGPVPDLDLIFSAQVAGWVEPCG